MIYLHIFDDSFDIYKKSGLIPSPFEDFKSFFRFQARNSIAVCTFRIKYDLPAHLWWFLWYLPKSGPIASHGLAGFLGSRANPAGSRLRGEIFLSNWLTHKLKLWVLSSQQPKPILWFPRKIDSKSKNVCNFRFDIRTIWYQPIRVMEPFYMKIQYLNLN